MIGDQNLLFFFFWWTFCKLELGHIIASLVTFMSEDTVRKQAGTIYKATHLTRHLSKQKVLNPALACLSVPDI